MGEYLHPGVYTETVPPTGRPVESVSTSTGVLVGVAERGKVNVPIFITSWSQYIETMAKGLDTPFIVNSDLAYSVYGFFQNGGRRAYILRVAKNAKKAQISVDTKEEIIFAQDEGIWGNNLTVIVSENTDDEDLFDIEVKLKGSVVERFTGYTNDTTSRKYFETINKISKFIEFVGGEDLVVGTYDLTGGSDGDALTDTDYLSALDNVETIQDRDLLSIPGQTSLPVLKGILDWCAKDQETFPILDCPLYTTTLEAKEIRKSLSAPRGSIYCPWVTVLDPLSLTGEPRPTPIAGHLMGMFARTTIERGVHKAPAGIESQIRGIIDVVTVFTDGDSDVLNPVSVNLIMPKPNYGIVCWGARTLNPDTTMRYVSDERLNTMIKKSLTNGTMWAVFEPNDPKLWRALRVSCEEYLFKLWKFDGALFGASKSEAYFVKCDAENNPQETRDAGFVYVDIGYAPVKPAEFVVMRIAHSMRALD